MNKYLIILLILNSVFLFGKDNVVEKTRQKFYSYNSLSYTTNAFYPNPETDELNSFSTFYIINNFKSKNFDFYSKTDHLEEIYKSDDYTKINNTEKSIYKYEEKKNQTDMIQNSRLIQYGPTFLLDYDWKYEDEIVINGIKQSHFSFIKDISKYKEKTIKVEFHIYISPNYTISKFQRKSYVDNKLGQTVTYEFSDYKFSKKEINFKISLPENYALKYFERSEINPFQKGVKAPDLEVEDINKNKLSEQDYIGNQTLLLFSSTNCGASKIVSDFINNENFQLPDNLKLINVYASDSQENIEKYYENRTSKFPIIVNQKEIEKKYQIYGYPVLYFIDDNGIISETYDGYEEIIQFLKSENKKLSHY